MTNEKVKPKASNPNRIEVKPETPNPNRILDKPSKLTLQLMLTAIVFVVITITMTLIGATMFTLLHFGVLDRPTIPGFNDALLLFALLSIVVGTVLSFLLGRIPLQPLNRVIAAMRQVAGGDFSPRLDPRSGRSEISELYESFNAMTEELQSVEILREDFINSFSHEFKTPIVSIRGFARMLKNSQLTEEERNEYLDIIISESERLADLSTNTLNLTRLENQKIISDAAGFPLGEQLRCCILILQPRWEAKGLSMDVELEDCDFLGSENMLSQVWMNLLDNAIKFAPEGGTVSAVLRREEDLLVCHICNNGPHISERGLVRIFDKFYQEDPSRASAGNGLGLAIVKKIVVLHGGTISARNLPETGVEFTVCLPCSMPH